MSLPDLSGVASAAGTRRLLEADGWRHLATGDWSWVYASPDGAHVARVAPWDPAYLLSVEVARRLAGNPYVPRVAEVASLAGVGHVVSLERLQPADATQAAALSAPVAQPITGLVDDTGGRTRARPGRHCPS